MNMCVYSQRLKELLFERLLLLLGGSANLLSFRRCSANLPSSLQMRFLPPLAHSLSLCSCRRQTSVTHTHTHYANGLKLLQCGPFRSIPFPFIKAEAEAEKIKVPLLPNATANCWLDDEEEEENRRIERIVESTTPLSIWKWILDYTKLLPCATFYFSYSQCPQEVFFASLLG